jgi:Ca2+-binding RTX toxin-like protein
MPGKASGVDTHPTGVARPYRSTFRLRGRGPACGQKAYFRQTSSSVRSMLTVAGTPAPAAVLEGTRGDVLVGTNVRDQMNGRGGDDTISGRRGTDNLVGSGPPDPRQRE